MKINYSTMKSLTYYGENYGKYWKLWTLIFYEKNILYLYDTLPKTI